MSGHKIFRISCIINLALICITSILYFVIDGIIDKFILKPIPLILLIFNIGYYFIIYKIHIYAMLLEGGFIFCMIGDILLMFYIPLIPKYNKPILLIAGGGSFFISRILFSLMLLVYPYKDVNERIIEVRIIKLVLFGIAPLVLSICLISYFSNIISNRTLVVLLSFYIIVMNLQLWLSLLRIKGFKEESMISQIFGFIGTLFFNVSDILLFINLFSSFIIPDTITMSFYWLGMYILMISVVRSSSFEREKKSRCSSELYPY